MRLLKVASWSQTIASAVMYLLMSAALICLAQAMYASCDWQYHINVANELVSIIASGNHLPPPMRVTGGRFLPLTYFDYNIFLNGCGDSPKLFYIFSIVKFFSTALFMLILLKQLRRTAKLERISEFILGLLAPVIILSFFVLPAVSTVAFNNIVFSEPTIITLLALFYLSFWNIYGAGGRFFAGITIFTVIWLVFLKEISFIPLVVVAVGHILLYWRSSLFRQKFVYITILVITGIFFFLYWWFVGRHTTNSYHSESALSFIEIFKSAFLIKPEVFLALTAFAVLRLSLITRKLFKKRKFSRIEILADCSFAGGVLWILSYAFLGLIRDYYITPSYLPLCISLYAYAIALQQSKINRASRICGCLILLFPVIYYGLNNYFPSVRRASAISLTREIRMDTIRTIVNSNYDAKYVLIPPYVKRDNYNSWMLNRHVFARLHHFGNIVNFANAKHIDWGGYPVKNSESILDPVWTPFIREPELRQEKDFVFASTEQIALESMRHFTTQPIYLISPASVNKLTLNFYGTKGIVDKIINNATDRQKRLLYPQLLFDTTVPHVKIHNASGMRFNGNNFIMGKDLELPNGVSGNFGFEILLKCSPKSDYPNTLGNNYSASYPAMPFSSSNFALQQFSKNLLRILHRKDKDSKWQMQDIRIPKNEWFTIQYIQNSGTTRVLINDIVVLVKPGILEMSWNTPAKVSIGKGWQKRFWTGEISYIKFFNTRTGKVFWQWIGKQH